MTQESIDKELEELAVRFSKGWHEGIKIDASDIMLLNMAAQALAQPEQEPVAIKRMKEWIEYLKRKSDFGQHMKIPSEISAGACWELAIELEQFINTTPPQRTEQEPVEIDQATMELAESVGLIGPTSRTHDLHQAIQRFHDLICVNATVKAAQMAADVIRESTPPQRKPWVGLTDEQIEQLEQDTCAMEFPETVRAIEAAHGIKGDT